MVSSNEALAAELRAATTAWEQAGHALAAERERQGPRLGDAEVAFQDAEATYKGTQLRVIQASRHAKEMTETGRIQEPELTQQDIDRARHTVECRARLAQQREQERGGREW